MNHLISKDGERLAACLADLDPTPIANLVVDGGWPHISSTTSALDRITHAADLNLRTAVVDSLDEDPLATMVDSAPER